jgi:folate-binding protein YgfZ
MTADGDSTTRTGSPGPTTAPDGLVDLRTTLGAVEVARDVVRVAGPDAVTYLQGQLSQDVVGLAAGSSAWSFLLQPTGKVDAWLRVTRVADDEVVLDVEGGHGSAVVARLRRFLLRTKADIDSLDLGCVALRGPGAVGAATRVRAELRVPAGWPGGEGVDLFGAGAGEVPAGAVSADLAAYESLRIRSGVPAMGAELTEATLPAEAGRHVIDASVSFTKGCFTGQELVARIDSRGGNVPRSVRGLDVPSDITLTPGAPVLVDGAEAGHVTSVAPRPGGGSVALAVLARRVVPPVPALVQVDGAPVEATVVDLPFGT